MSTCLQRHPGCQRKGRAGPQDREADRRSGPNHQHQHLWLRSSYVRGPHRSEPAVGFSRAREPRPGVEVGTLSTGSRSATGSACRSKHQLRNLAATHERTASPPSAYELNPGKAGAAYGFAHGAAYHGGQAEYLRVPYAPTTTVCGSAGRGGEAGRLHRDGRRHLPDRLARTDSPACGPARSVVIYGAGPVGLMAAYSAMIQGASKVMVVDRHPDRLRLAESVGASRSAIQRIAGRSGPGGRPTARRRPGCECVGYQCHDHHGHERPNLTMNNLVANR